MFADAYDFSRKNNTIIAQQFLFFLANKTKVIKRAARYVGWGPLLCAQVSDGQPWRKKSEPGGVRHWRQEAEPVPDSKATDYIQTPWTLSPSSLPLILISFSLALFSFLHFLFISSFLPPLFLPSLPSYLPPFFSSLLFPLPNFLLCLPLQHHIPSLSLLSPSWCSPLSRHFLYD